MSSIPSSTEADLAELAQSLYRANTDGVAIAPLSTRCALSVRDAYDIQLRVLHMQVAEGRQTVGRKVGLTSRAMQEALGVDQPDFGHLFADKQVANGARLGARDFIAPRAEPETAFRLKADLRGPGISADDVRDAVDAVYPALEIIDSRISDWRITLVDTIADNASFGAFVLGDPIDPREIDLAALLCRMEVNGETVESGLGSAVLGHPFNAVAWLANTLGEYDAHVAAGDIVLPGSMTRAVPFAPGDEIRADFGALGAVGISVEPDPA